MFFVNLGFSTTSLGVLNVCVNCFEVTELLLILLPSVLSAIWAMLI
jgi:hypothetical protein